MPAFDYYRSLIPLIAKDISPFVQLATEFLCRKIQKALGIMICSVRFEQSDTSIGFLEAQLSCSAPWRPISCKTPTLLNSDKVPGSLDRWLDPLAQNAKAMLKSMIPNCVKKIQHLRLNTLAAFKSFVCLTLCLRLKYPQTWWKKSLVMCSNCCTFIPRNDCPEGLYCCGIHTVRCLFPVPPGVLCSA